MRKLLCSNHNIPHKAPLELLLTSLRGPSVTCGDDNWLGLVYLQLKAATSQFKPWHVKGSEDAPEVCLGCTDHAVQASV